MRAEIYTCDGCKTQIPYEPQDWLTIGSDDYCSLKIRNGLQDRGIISISTHDDIHFCSKDCLLNFFFKRPDVFVQPFTK